MAYQYIVAPNRDKIANRISVFLAGGISNCEDWQKNVAKSLSKLDRLTVVNPRRNNWKVDKNEIEESAKQIVWEFGYIRRVSNVIFWFTDDTLQPITLYELGATLQRNTETDKQKVFIGADSKYKRILDVKIQAKLMGYCVSESLEEVLNDFARYYWGVTVE